MNLETVDWGARTGKATSTERIVSGSLSKRLQMQCSYEGHRAILACMKTTDTRDMHGLKLMRCAAGITLGDYGNNGTNGEYSQPTEFEPNFKHLIVALNVLRRELYRSMSLMPITYSVSQERIYRSTKPNVKASGHINARCLARQYCFAC